MKSTIEACIECLARSSDTIESRAWLLFLLKVREWVLGSEIYILPHVFLPAGYACAIPARCKNAADVTAWLNEVLDQELLREFGLTLWLTGAP